MNLASQLTSDIPQPKMKGEGSDEDEDHFYPHWQSNIDINLICDPTKYSVTGGIPPEIARAIHVDWASMTYEPIIYLSNYWNLKKNMRALNDTLDG